MKKHTVLSLEQALALPYATLRFVHLGWRVIRIETPALGPGSFGDPNRHIGKRIVDDDRHSYFIAPNVGKEAITLNLKDPRGHDVLKRLIGSLDVDIFCCNTVPSRYKMLGIDYDSLKAVKPDIIWAGISAMGPEYPDIAGYDPAMQATVGFMDLTGAPDGPPTLCGVPIIDLKAGDDLFSAVCLALAERMESGRGKAINISMLQSAASWLITTLPLIDCGCDPSEITRWGSAHRKFIPTNAYPTKDGFIYLAIGNDIQWRKLISIPKFASLATGDRETNNGRLAECEALYLDIGAITKKYVTKELANDFRETGLVHSEINGVARVLDIEALQQILTKTTTPDGRVIRMQPMSHKVSGADIEFSFAPKYGEHTFKVLAEAGFSKKQIHEFVATKVV